MTVRLPGSENAVLRGRFRGLDNDGGLIVVADGETHRILAGEVLFQPAPALQAGVG